MPRHHPIDPLMGSRRDPPDVHTGHQLTFAAARAAESAQSVTESARRAAHDRACDMAAEISAPRNDEEDRLVAWLWSLLCRYIDIRGEGARFFASDFDTWLDTTRQRPVSYDMRRSSGLYRRALKRGILAHDGYAPNGGGPNSNSTPRSRYRVVRLTTLEDQQ